MDMTKKLSLFTAILGFSLVKIFVNSVIVKAEYSQKSSIEIDKYQLKK